MELTVHPCLPLHTKIPTKWKSDIVSAFPFWLLSIDQSCLSNLIWLAIQSKIVYWLPSVSTYVHMFSAIILGEYCFIAPSGKSMSYTIYTILISIGLFSTLLFSSPLESLWQAITVAWGNLLIVGVVPLHWPMYHIFGHQFLCIVWENQ